MLLCGIEQVKAGMVVGCPINHPKRPDRELLTEGVALDQKMISRLAQLDVRAIWIRHDALADMDHVVGTKLREARENVYQQFRKDIAGLQGGTLATGEVLAYRQTVMALICELMGNRHLVGMTDYLFDARNDQFSHGVGVAFLSLLGGLALENYIIEERARLNIEHSRDLTNLGIGGMFHDIGKGLIGQQIADQHEIRSRDGQAPEAPKPDDPYADHPQAGYRALRECKINASALTAVLNHHQRFDGSGWPDLTEQSQGRIKGPATGTPDSHLCPNRRRRQRVGQPRSFVRSPAARCRPQDAAILSIRRLVRSGGARHDDARHPALPHRRHGGAQ